MNILDLREKRYELYKKLNKNILAIKPNALGADKRNVYSNYVSYVFYDIFKDYFERPIIEFDSEGLIFIFELPDDLGLIDLKKKLVGLEESHPLGRPVDLDIITKDQSEIGRTSLGFPPRTCLICDKNAKVCSRSQAHDKEDLDRAFKERVLDYVFQKDSRIRLVEFTLLNELMREVSLGTVTPLTSGAHNDMDVFTFFKSLDLLSRELLKVKEIDYKDFKALKNLGLEIEEEMLEITGGANTHKGMVFHFLLILSSILSKDDLPSSRERIKELGSLSFDKDFYNPCNKSYMRYNKNKVLGARGEALKAYELSFNLDSDLNNLDQAFLRLAEHSEDTNIINRRGYDFYLSYKEKISSYLSGEISLESLEDFCMANNISAGGSCDLLSIFIFYKLLRLDYNKFKEVLL